MLEASVMHVQRNHTPNKNMQRGTCIMGSRTYIIQQVYIIYIIQLHIYVKDPQVLVLQ